jgi:hypothetical protein
MIELSKEWINQLINIPETGMGYQIVSIVLSDGTKYDQVVVDSGYITQIKGFEVIPFSEEDIQEIIVTHDKWDFGAGQR